MPKFRGNRLRERVRVIIYTNIIIPFCVYYSYIEGSVRESKISALRYSPPPSLKKG